MSLSLKIEHDEYCNDIWEDESELIFLSNHRDYSSRNNDGVEIDQFESMDELKAHYGNDFEIVAINAYIHSGIALSLNEFNCQWDSGLFGLLIFKKGEFGENDQGLKGFVETWSMNWNGENYAYTIEDEKGEILDSCCGFVGHENAIEKGKSALKYLMDEMKKNRENKVKQLIKNKVPLILRERALNQLTA